MPGPVERGRSRNLREVSPTYYAQRGPAGIRGSGGGDGKRTTRFAAASSRNLSIMAYGGARLPGRSSTTGCRPSPCATTGERIVFLPPVGGSTETRANFPPAPIGEHRARRTDRPAVFPASKTEDGCRGDRNMSCGCAVSTSRPVISASPISRRRCLDEEGFLLQSAIGPGVFCRSRGSPAGHHLLRGRVGGKTSS